MHASIVHKTGRWPQDASDVLDMADMLVAYLSGEAVKRKAEPGVEGVGLQWRGVWKRQIYAGSIRRAMYLLAVRRGQKGKMRLPGNWKERLEAAGIGWESMEVVDKARWGRAWKQFCDLDSFKLETQNRWNALGVEAPWPPPTLEWESRANKRIRKESRAQESQEAGQVGPQPSSVIARRIRKVLVQED